MFDSQEQIFDWMVITTPGPAPPVAQVQPVEASELLLHGLLMSFQWVN